MSNLSVNEAIIGSKSRGGSKSNIVIILIFLVVLLVGSNLINARTNSSIMNFIETKTGLFKKENPETNVLLLGIGGGKHDGALLSDTIIIANFNAETKKALLISVPRDLWLDSIKNKVNAVYETGIAKKDPYGFTKKTFSDLVGLPIQNMVVLDFAGFVKAVDQVGGLSINVVNSFDDFNYPVTGKEADACGNVEKEVELTPEQVLALKTQPGKAKVLVAADGHVATQAADFACRFEHLQFKKGQNQMDGETALKYVRSRMGTNGEGSDFARSARQQLVLEAFRSKVISSDTLLNPQKVTSLISTFGDSVHTDIPIEQLLKFYNMAKSAAEIKTVVLGDLGNGKSLFITPSGGSYGAWVLVPKTGNFNEVQTLIQQLKSGKVASGSGLIKN